MTQRKINHLEEATISELQAFIDAGMRERSPKTGKLIKINTYKWNKARLVNFILDSGYRLDAIEFINEYLY